MALWEILGAYAVGMTGYLTVNVGRNVFYFELLFGYWSREKLAGSRIEQSCSQAATDQFCSKSRTVLQIFLYPFRSS